jgi:spore germination protein
MKKLAIFLFITASYALPAFASTFDTAIWIPYWRKDGGATSTLANITKVSQISPFAFELRNNVITDALKVQEEPWPSLIAEAKSKNIRVYPTILSYPQTGTEQNQVYLLLAQRKQRKAHEDAIVKLVTENRFDGIDIDYENKITDDRPYFSSFLKELGVALHKNKKKLICTVEARTPPESKFATTSAAILSKIEYSNDYGAIGQACDQVRIMAYDQGSDDLSLVNRNTALGDAYKPVADIEWVKKIATLALKDIPAKKIILGVPTYGYKYEIVPATATSGVKYPRVGSMNFNYADDLAKSLNITPARNSAGELSFTYATTTGVEGEQLGGLKQYLIWYSDAQAIADKIRIAKLYNLGGVAVFKIDGGQDPNLWAVLSKSTVAAR